MSGVRKLLCGLAAFMCLSWVLAIRFESTMDMPAPYHHSA
ncbi:hypothetical protein CORMATOL_00869 [Corynebacterium matruchotii ATCC 33806]|uniref:Uncharacterized protein n=1 Tax=Corynebacterium matruchotii ATCC 33806 TaxID=566549 RepID=C0E1L8_9CORY|nr:hypothetical protein CORMATOL_00869 [Corynebacterium matruchotii ATCC 33806]